jgi:dihydrofolate reductase
MARFGAEFSMSLDGFVADANDGVEEVFAWYSAGDVTIPTAMEGLEFQTSEADAEHIHRGFSQIGAVLSGRRTFETAGGWGGNHPMGVPTVVLTHSIPDGWPREGSSLHFNTESLESAVAQAAEIAGDKLVGVTGPNVVQQCLNAGVLDELVVNLVPVLLGSGIRYFDNLTGTPSHLDGPRISSGNGVIHLYYDVRK